MTGLLLLLTTSFPRRDRPSPDASSSTLLHPTANTFPGHQHAAPTPAQTPPTLSPLLGPAPTQSPNPAPRSSPQDRPTTTRPRPPALIPMGLRPSRYRHVTPTERWFSRDDGRACSRRMSPRRRCLREGRLVGASSRECGEVWRFHPTQAHQGKRAGRHLGRSHAVWSGDDATAWRGAVVIRIS